MSIHVCLLLLGSNLGDRKKTIESAHESINQEIGNTLKSSELLETEPIGFETSHFFLNQIVEIQTSLSPMQLLHKTQEIERQLGRIQKTTTTYTDRSIDIDILTYDKLDFRCEKLQIPHPKNMFERTFVKEILKKLC